MTDQRWDTLERLFHEASELSGAERDGFLREHCAGDRALQREIEDLLGYSANDDTDFDPVTPLAEMVQQETALDDGTRVGPFQLVRLLGTGGMGRVYEAEQSEPKRTVALKMIKVALASDKDRRRFRYETETLAQLHHPNIAQLYQVGTHVIPDGLGGELPYFAMELVESARTLVRFADEERLSLKSKLQLFQAVCAAVQYGHQRGVMHRDLKPANLLVSGDGDVKVIDFGIARVLEAEADTQLTAAGGLVGTIAYLAPEKLESPFAAPDVRSDVYSLGVILFELLASTLPHDLTETPLHKVADVVQRAPARRLAELTAEVPSELEWIVGKAMDPDVERRYDSAAALAEDLGRFERNEPVAAGPPSRAYRMRKFVQRNRLAVGAGVAVVVALVAGLISVWLALQEVQEQFQQKQRAATFFTEMLQMGDPEIGGRQVRLVDAVQRHAPRIEEEFADQPEVRLLLHTTVGNVLGSLGYNAESEVHLRLAFALGLELEGRERTMAVGVGGPLGSALMHMGQYEEAERLLADAAEARERVLGPADRRTPLAYKDLGVLLYDTGRLKESGEVSWKAYSMALEHLGPTDQETLRCAIYVSSAFLHDHRLEEAEEVLDALTPHVLAVSETNAVIELMFRNQLALLRRHQGRLAEAEEVLLEGLGKVDGSFGSQHPEHYRTLHNLGSVRLQMGKPDEAEADLRVALAGLDQALGAEHLDRQRVKHQLARLLAQVGRTEEAESFCREILAAFEASVGVDHNVALSTTNLLGVLLLEQGKLEEGEALLRGAAERGAAKYGENSPNVLHSKANLGAAFTKQRRFPEAEVMLRDVLAIREQIEPESINILTTLTNLAHSVSEQTREAEAKVLLERVVKRAEELNLHVHPTLLTARSNLASILSSEGDYARAAEQYKGVLAIRTQSLGLEHRSTILSMNNVAVTLRRQGNVEEAVDYLERAIAASRRHPSFDPVLRAQFLYNQAVFLKQLEQWDSALAKVTESYEQHLKHSGPTDEWTVAAKAILEELEARPKDD